MGFGFDSTAEEVTEGLDLSGRTFAVTGCSSGLGRETVRVLALRGARVVGLARTEGKARATLDELGVDGIPVACDLADLGSVRAAAKAVREVAPLAGIVANAGVMALPQVERVAGIERQFFVNHVGHFALVTALVDALSDDGRVVVVSSAAHRMAPEQGIALDDLGAHGGYHPWAAYGQSKLANLLFARSLARRLDGTGRTANSLHPGVIRTRLGRHIPEAERAEMYARLKRVEKTVAQGAATQCFVATHPSVAGVRGAYFSDCQVADTLHPRAGDDELAEALWARTEAILAEA